MQDADTNASEIELLLIGINGPLIQWIIGKKQVGNLVIGLQKDTMASPTLYNARFLQ